MSAALKFSSHKTDIIWRQNTSGRKWASFKPRTHSSENQTSAQHVHVCISVSANLSSRACSECSRPGTSHYLRSSGCTNAVITVRLWSDISSCVTTVTIFDASAFLREKWQEFPLLPVPRNTVLSFLSAITDLKWHCCKIKPLCTQTQRDLCTHLLSQQFLL